MSWLPMNWLPLVPVALPLLAAGVHAVAGWRRAACLTGTGLLALVGVDAVTLAVAVGRHGPISAAGGLLRADALSAWMLLVLAAVATLACWASPAALAGHPVPARRARWYGILLHLFVAAMTIAVLAGNLGVLWAAIEATTVITTFLVAHHRTRGALEAAWKYVVICSAAIGVALLGTVMLYAAARHAGLPTDKALDWASLTARAHAHRLDPAVTRIGIGLAVLGFGAKAGLIPLHAWLPDAHSQAPAPVSALMSGVLLSVAFYAVLRYKAIADAALGTGYTRILLLILALATLTVAAVLLIGQRDYKRMLAYSSMEHMGLIALGAAIGGQLAMAAVLLHIAGHGLAKAVAFLSSGHVLTAAGTSRISGVRGLAARSPRLAAVLGLAVLCLLGFPPAAVFASELGIARAGFAADGLGWAVAAALVLVLICFAALAAHTGRMLLGAADPRAAASPPLPAAAVAPLAVGLLAVTALGVGSSPLVALLHTAAAALGAS